MSVLVCVDDPAEAGARYGRFVGRTPAGRGELVTLKLDRGLLAFATPARCRSLLGGSAIPGAPSIVAIGLVTRQPEVTREFLVKRAVAPVTLSQGVYCVGPEHSMGAAMVFHGPGAAWPA